jgi:hypothetical protein
MGFPPPAVRAPVDGHGSRSQPAVETPWGDIGVEFRAKGYLPEALVNYLALIGWSPGHDDELLPIDELARRFSLEGRRAQRRRVRRGEAGVGEPPLPEDCRSGADCRIVDPVFQRCRRRVGPE